MLQSTKNLYNNFLGTVEEVKALGLEIWQSLAMQIHSVRKYSSKPAIKIEEVIQAYILC